MDKFVDDFSEPFLEKKEMIDLEMMDLWEESAHKKLQIKNYLQTLLEKHDGAEVESQMKEIRDIQDWSDLNLEQLRRETDSKELGNKLNLDVSIAEQKKGELAEMLITNEETLSEYVLFFGDYNTVVVYRPDIDYWFTAKLEINNTNVTNKFSLLPGLQASLIYHDKIIFSGGYKSNELWEFTISNKEIKFLKYMNSVREFHGTVVHNGGLFIIGGFDSSNGQHLGSCEYFDYQMKTLTSLPDMITPRAQFGVTLSHNERFFFIIHL